MVETPGWTFTERIAKARLSLNPSSMLLSLSPSFTDKWGSEHKRQGKVEDPVFLRYGRVAVSAEKPRCRPDRLMTLPGDGCSTTLHRCDTGDLLNENTSASSFALRIGE